MVLATFYILYAGITNTFNSILFISIGLLAMEILVLLFNKWTCPFTPLAARYTSEESRLIGLQNTTKPFSERFLL